MRISMSLPKELLKDFDEVLNDRGYQSRSKGIRDALKDYIIRYKWMQDMEGERIGILTVIYDHHKTGVIKNLYDIQHDFQQHINSVLHVHVAENHCLEVIIVEGDVKTIKKFTEEIMKLEGIEHLKLTSIAPL